ncbi:DUF1294 domain-containing protein [Janthinobacterium sp.]|uniref:DUF1294 domain-containing protein n=1 Tax=Janthinobacterium sp. TaxID=1871054 RepID=UPI00293D4FB8|nr:DUF1294 domain-containing protein [Janthinobacterium sp.]
MQYIPIFAFALLYLGATLAWGVSHWIGAAYLGASAVCFIAYARDKAAARGGRRRTPESTLLMLGLACGWPGALLAQQWLRHKSSKPAFRRKFWCTVALNASAFAYLGHWSAA